MRQALSVALIEYSGALVLIAHDRHLLRSVCDELLIVHDGVVDRFNRSLDEYPDWLREQEQLAEEDADVRRTPSTKRGNRKQQRQQEAEERKRLKPLRDKVRKVESALATNRSRLVELDTQLADEDLYSDPGRKDEMTRLIQEQAAVKADIESLEWEWLEASENLEQAT